MSNARDLADLADDATTVPTTTYTPVTHIPLINGNMAVAQRSTSETGIGSADGYFTVDRWGLQHGTYSGTRWTMTQTALTPGTDEPCDSGHRQSLKLDCTTADASPAAGDRAYLTYRAEGFDVQMLGYGDAQAQDFTVGFWHKHTLTGTHVVSSWQGAGNRWAAKQYTQAVTNTWEYSTVTIAADTTNALANTNANILQLHFGLYGGTNYTSGSEAVWGTTAANQLPGQVNNGSSTSNNFEITGVDWVLGDTIAKTDYPHESYGDTLAKCQRYYFKTFAQGTAPAQNVGEDTGELKWICTGSSPYRITVTYPFPVTMRATPTVTTYNPAAANALARNTVDNTDESVGATTSRTNHLVVGAAASSDNAGDSMGMHCVAVAEI
jgi:hypothetical protein